MMDGSASSVIVANEEVARSHESANDVETDGGAIFVRVDAAVGGNSSKPYQSKADDAADGSGDGDAGDGEKCMGDQRPPPAPPEKSLSAPTSPSQRGKFSVPETPMWRFVAKAKKTEGYSSGAAGTVVKGLSSEELAGKYQVSEWKDSKKKGTEVLHARTILDDLESKPKEVRKVGKLDLSSFDEEDVVEETFEYAGRQKGKDGPGDDIVAEEKKYNMPQQAPVDENIEDDVVAKQQLESEEEEAVKELMPGDTSVSGESEVTIVEVTPATALDNQLDQAEKQLPNDEQSPNLYQDKPQADKKKRWALLLLLFLVIIAIILGVVLSRNNEESEEANKVIGGEPLNADKVEEEENIFDDTTAAVTPDPTNSPTQKASLSPTPKASQSPTGSPTTYCPANTKLFSVRHSSQPEESSLATNVTNTWVVLDACSQEEVLRCLPCPDGMSQGEIMRLQEGNVRQRRALQGNAIGPAKYLASSDGLSACIPDKYEYVFEVRQDEGECCGFNPDSFVITYDDTSVMQQMPIETIFSGGEIGADKPVDSKAYFSSENTEPCPTTMPSYMPSALPTETTEAPSFYPSPNPTKEPTSSPSSKPTAQPTKKPTGQPTPAPTFEPSPPPTSRPTPRPTGEPTEKPSCDDRYEDFNLCFAIDMSGSVCNQGTGYECDLCEPELICKSVDIDKGTCCNNFADVIDFSKLMVSMLESNIVAEKSYSVVGFGNSAKLASDLSSPSQTLDALDKLTYLGGRTNHADAINVCRDSLIGSGDNRKNLILLITDGDPSEPQGTPQADAEQAADAAKSDGISIIPVMVVPQFTTFIAAPLAYLEGISSDGMVFDVSDFDVLDGLRFSLVAQVSCQV